MSLKINPRVDGDTVVLDLSGRLWILELPLRDLVQSLLERNCRFFVLNLKDVEYIDSSGLGQMVSIWTSVRSRGGNVAVLNPVERVVRLLTITRLHVVLDVFEDEAKARVAIRRADLAKQLDA